MSDWCNSYDCGWCYHPESGVSECPGQLNCPMKSPKRKVPRIDEVASNGNEGTHYLVEQICNIIWESHKAHPKYDAKDWIPEAMEILDCIEDAEQGRKPQGD